MQQKEKLWTLTSGTEGSYEDTEGGRRERDRRLGKGGQVSCPYCERTC